MTDRTQPLDSASSFETKVKTDSPRFERNQKAMAELVGQIRNEEEIIGRGGGEKAIEAQHKKNRLTARERIALLADPGTDFFELGSFAAWGMFIDRANECDGTTLVPGTITGPVFGSDSITLLKLFFTSRRLSIFITRLTPSSVVQSSYGGPGIGVDD